MKLINQSEIRGAPKGTFEIGDRNAEVEMTYDWPHDYPITTAVAAALAELTDGAVCDNDAGDWYTAGDEAWAWAKHARKKYGNVNPD